MLDLRMQITKRIEFATAARLRPTLSAMSSCRIQIRLPAWRNLGASSMGLRSARCKFSIRESRALPESLALRIITALE